ncbi:MAG: UMP kinase [Candidatus Thalassarchaeaceae archaeon]|jgi:uridylate kinase|nr:UMP kinase [Candidatus Thalassarchaeaceae archaeon]
MSEVVIVALGGSLMYDGGDIDQQWVEDASKIIAQTASAGTKIGIVIGGGHLARENIATARKSGVTDTFDLDLVGIAATRYNATAFAAALKSTGVDVSENVPETTTDATESLQNHSVIVMGGTIPGHTTDAVSINLAVDSGAKRCTIATNVDFVYDKAPQINPDAIPFEEMTLAELQSIVGPPEHRGAGPNVVIDPIGVQIAIDNSIELALLNGRELERLAKCLAGETFRGTIIGVN